MHEKCIENKLSYIGENSDEVMNSYVLLAHNYMKNEDHLGNLSYLEKALQICRTINGDYTETTAYSMVQVADAYQAEEDYSKAINSLEHGGMILSKLEHQKHSITG